jgi:hypothetical protein
MQEAQIQTKETNAEKRQAAAARKAQKKISEEEEFQKAYTDYSDANERVCMLREQINGSITITGSVHNTSFAGACHQLLIFYFHPSVKMAKLTKVLCLVFLLHFLRVQCCKSIRTLDPPVNCPTLYQLFYQCWSCLKDFFRWRIPSLQIFYFSPSCNRV